MFFWTAGDHAAMKPTPLALSCASTGSREPSNMLGLSKCRTESLINSLSVTTASARLTKTDKARKFHFLTLENQAGSVL